jgi:hypothetical protein
VHDIGLVQLPPELFHPRKLEDFGCIEVGQRLTGNGTVFLQGMVVHDDKDSCRLLAHAMSAPGSSGGPMVNDLGQVCAVVHGIDKHRTKGKPSAGDDYDAPKPIVYLDRITPLCENPPITNWLRILPQNERAKAFLQASECDLSDLWQTTLGALASTKDMKTDLVPWLEALKQVSEIDDSKTVLFHLQQVARQLSEESVLHWVSKCRVVVEISEASTAHLSNEARQMHNAAIERYRRLRGGNRRGSWRRCRDVSWALLGLHGKLVKTNVGGRSGRTLEQYCDDLDAALGLQPRIQRK